MTDAFMAAYERAEERNDLVHKYEWNSDYYKSESKVGKTNLALNSSSAALLAGSAVYHHKKAKKLEQEGADEQTIKKHKRRRNLSVAGSVLSGLSGAANVAGIAAVKHYDKKLAHMSTETDARGKKTYYYEDSDNAYTENRNAVAGLNAPKKNSKALAIAGGVTGAAAITGGVTAAVAAHRKKKKKKQQEEKKGAR